MEEISPNFYRAKKLVRAVSYTKNIKVAENSYNPEIINSLAFLAAKDLIRTNSLNKWHELNINDFKEYYNKIMGK